MLRKKVMLNICMCIGIQHRSIMHLIGVLMNLTYIADKASPTGSTNASCWHKYRAALVFEVSNPHSNPSTKMPHANPTRHS